MCGLSQKLGQTIPAVNFSHERQLMKEGKQDSAQFVSYIRYNCMVHLEMIDKSKEEEADRAFEKAENKMARGGSGNSES